MERSKSFGGDTGKWDFLGLVRTERDLKTGGVVVGRRKLGGKLKAENNGRRGSNRTTSLKTASGPCVGRRSVFLGMAVPAECAPRVSHKDLVCTSNGSVQCQSQWPVSSEK
jgi:hypothetical protein